MVSKSFEELARECIHREDSHRGQGEVSTDRLSAATEVLGTAEVPAFMPSTPEALVQGSWEKSAQAQLHSEPEQLEKAYCIEEVGPAPSPNPSQTYWAAANSTDASNATTVF